MKLELVEHKPSEVVHQPDEHHMFWVIDTEGAPDTDPTEIGRVFSPHRREPAGAKHRFRFTDGNPDLTAAELSAIAGILEKLDETRDEFLT